MDSPISYEELNSALAKLKLKKSPGPRPTHFPRFSKAVVTQCNQHILVHRRAKIQPNQLISKLQYLPSQETKMTHRKKLLTLSYIDDPYPQDTWIRIYTDGSTTDAIQDGGTGSIIYLPDGDTIESATATGKHCTNYAANVKALSQ